MMKPMSQLIGILREKLLAPTRTIHQTNGKTTLRWHVDNDDDRYVEASDSLRSDTFVLHCSDKLDAAIIVVKDVPSAVTWIDTQLQVLHKTPK
jgi:hypothetical protein